MAWHDIARRCDHDERVQIYGPHRDRPAQVRREQAKLCHACHEAKKLADRAEASADAATQARIDGLPELAGSERQVAWALTIREHTIQTLVNRHPAAAQYNYLLDVICGHTAARWWIDNRDGLRDTGAWYGLRESLTAQQREAVAALGALAEEERNES